MTNPTNYANVKMQRRLDSDGYSGAINVPASDGINESPLLVFVDSELLGNLVLTAAEAAELSTALADAAAEGLPPSEGSLKAFRVVFGHDAEPEHSRTAADLARRVDQLSGGATFVSGSALVTVTPPE